MLTHTSPTIWLAFFGLLALLLVLDLGVLNRRAHAPTTREAAAWSGGLLALAIAFAGVLWIREGQQRALEFATGYVVELSLSVDNLFVFLLLFQYFAVPPALQPKVLKWGILGALVMRGLMISTGALLLQRFAWVVFVFGGILIVTGLRMFRDDFDQLLNPEDHFIVRWAKALLPFDSRYHGTRFTTRKAPRQATLLLLVLVVVEWTDLVFAIDSIPAVFAVTRDPFVVYSSNILAILGLRAVFFLLAGMMSRFRYPQSPRASR